MDYLEIREGELVVNTELLSSFDLFKKEIAYAIACAVHSHKQQTGKGLWTSLFVYKEGAPLTERGFPKGFDLHYRLPIDNKDKKKKALKLLNVVVQLHEDTSVLEIKRLFGDIGVLIWKDFSEKGEFHKTLKTLFRALTKEF